MVDPHVMQELSCGLHILGYGTVKNQQVVEYYCTVENPERNGQHKKVGTLPGLGTLGTASLKI